MVERGDQEVAVEGRVEVLEVGRPRSLARWSALECWGHPNSPTLSFALFFFPPLGRLEA